MGLKEWFSKKIYDDEIIAKDIFHKEAIELLAAPFGITFVRILVSKPTQYYFTKS